MVVNWNATWYLVLRSSTEFSNLQSNVDVNYLAAFNINYINTGTQSGYESIIFGVTMFGYEITRVLHNKLTLVYIYSKIKRQLKSDIIIAFSAIKIVKIR